MEKKINLNVEFDVKEMKQLRMARIAFQKSLGVELNWHDFIMELIQ
jgi:hypothetical protein